MVRKCFQFKISIDFVNTRGAIQMKNIRNSKNLIWLDGNFIETLMIHLNCKY